MTKKAAKRVAKHTGAKKTGAKKTSASRPSGIRVLDVKPGTYADGMPLHEVQYLECKLILKPNHFTSRQSLFDFVKVMRRPAAEHEVGFSGKEFVDAPLQIREVLFMDTADSRLYSNAFILRRRIRYEDGFPVGEPEIVFKFRHPDVQKAAEVDVRPQIYGDYRIKMKAEAMPLKNGLGGSRLLFSHNVQFPMSHVHEENPSSLATLMRVLPPLQRVKASRNEHLELVISGRHVADVDPLHAALSQGLELFEAVDVVRNELAVDLDAHGVKAHLIAFGHRDEDRDLCVRWVEQFLLELA